MAHHGIALALGGGGMFGAYQAGLWAGLQPSFTPAHVFGASIGAFNGLAVASGCKANDLVDLWLDFREAAEARWRFPWPPHSGCIDATQFHDYLRRHFHRFPPVLPMTVAITRLRPFRPFAVSGADLTWRHLAASCSVPVIMPPCRLPEGLGMDGGLITAVPAWAALDAGFERIVAVNILPGAGGPVLKTLKRAMCKLSRFDPAAGSGQPDPNLIWVEPSQPLGPLWRSAKWDPALARDWVLLGRHDAAAVLRRIECVT
jgi:NTE family protein